MKIEHTLDSRVKQPKQSQANGFIETVEYY